MGAGEGHRLLGAGGDSGRAGLCCWSSGGRRLCGSLQCRLLQGRGTDSGALGPVRGARCVAADGKVGVHLGHAENERLARQKPCFLRPAGVVAGSGEDGAPEGGVGRVAVQLQLQPRADPLYRSVLVQLGPYAHVATVVHHGGEPPASLLQPDGEPYELEVGQHRAVHRTLYLELPLLVGVAGERVRRLLREIKLATCTHHGINWEIDLLAMDTYCFVQVTISRRSK